jgi:hypothetical protein
MSIVGFEFRIFIVLFFKSGFSNFGSYTATCRNMPFCDTKK